MELFKYCRAAHMQSAREFGSVRIGTLSDYGKTDKYGEYVSDAKEGTKKLSGSVPELSFENISQYPGLQGFISLVPGAKIKNLVFTDNVVGAPDLLIFSASSKYDSNIHNRWFVEEGYDACYRITSAEHFLGAISEALGKEFRFLGYREVVYADDIHIVDPKSAIHPAFVKRQSHHIEQSEIRAAWAHVSENPITPIILQQSNVNMYVCPHATLATDEA